MTSVFFSFFYKDIKKWKRIVIFNFHCELIITILIVESKHVTLLFQMLPENISEERSDLIVVPEIY